MKETRRHEYKTKGGKGIYIFFGDRWKRKYINKKMKETRRHMYTKLRMEKELYFFFGDRWERNYIEGQIITVKIETEQMKDGKRV